MGWDKGNGLGSPGHWETETRATRSLKESALADQGALAPGVGERLLREVGERIQTRP